MIYVMRSISMVGVKNCVVLSVGVSGCIIIIILVINFIGDSYTDFDSHCKEKPLCALLL